MEKKAILIGASSGIGEALGRLLAARGYRVALAARRSDLLHRLADDINAREGRRMAFPYLHDVTQTESVEPLFQRMIEDLGGLDLLVFNSGLLIEIGPHEYNYAKDRAIFEVNTLGAIHLLNQGATFFEKKGSGALAGVSSVAGDRGRRPNPAYGASKAALNSFLESLRNRLLVQGVTVTTIKPGYVETPMTAGKNGLFWVISSEEAARQILGAVERGHNEVYVPARWRWLMMILRFLPTFVFKRLNV